MSLSGRSGGLYIEARDCFPGFRCFPLGMTGGPAGSRWGGLTTSRRSGAISELQGGGSALLPRMYVGVWSGPESTTAVNAQVADLSSLLGRY